MSSPDGLFEELKEKSFDEILKEKWNSEDSPVRQLRK